MHIINLSEQFTVMRWSGFYSATPATLRRPLRIWLAIQTDELPIFLDSWLVVSRFQKVFNRTCQPQVLLAKTSPSLTGHKDLRDIRISKDSTGTSYLTVLMHKSFFYVSFGDLNMSRKPGSFFYPELLNSIPVYFLAVFPKTKNCICGINNIQ